MTQPKKIVIIGAGPGGLAAAMLLSQTGAQVTVLERQDRVGGRTASFEDSGFRFDLGPTFFLYPEILEEIFTECGLDLHDRVDLKKLDPHYRLFYEGDDTLLSRPDLDHMETEVERLSPQDAGGFKRFVEDNRKKFEAFTPILQMPFSSPLSLVKPSLLKALPFLRIRQSVESDLRRFFGDERLRMACAFQAKYLGMAPTSCPSLFTILSYLEYAYGIFHPVGGCGAVSEAMATAARELGVTIQLAEPVTKLEFEGKRATRAITPNASYDCDALVVNADFSHAMRHLVPDELRSTWSDKTIEKKKYSCSTFMLYLGINRELPELEHHSIFLSDVYRDNLSDIEHAHQLSENPSFYVCNPTRTDPSMAPPGKSALYILVPVSHQHENIDWAAEQRRYRDLTIRQLEKIGIPDITPDIEFERMITPTDWQNDYAIHKGAVFNLAHNIGQMLHLRPQNRFKELDGVYLVGGGTHPGSGLPVIYESARISCKLLRKDLGL